MRFFFFLDMRQCLIYDSAEANARLIGVEYLVSPRVFATLDEDEKKFWHSHVFEVKSGMLVMPAPHTVPDLVWEKAELAEMEEIVGWYGKMYVLAQNPPQKGKRSSSRVTIPFYPRYHFWQVDRGDPLPLGELGIIFFFFFSPFP